MSTAVDSVLAWERATVLTVVELSACWELLDLGESPLHLDLPSPGATADEHRAIVAAVLGGLRDRGLAGPLGPVIPLADRLRVLARPDHQFDLRLSGTSLMTAISAVRARRGVLAVRHGSEVALLDTTPASGVPGLVELLGPLRPGPGWSVGLPAQVFDAARVGSPDDPDRFADVLNRHGIPRSDTDVLVAMTRGAVRLGQFGAAQRGPDERLRRAPHVVGLHRTEAGDYCQLRRGDGRGRDTVTIAPLDRDTLLGHLDRLAALTAVPTSWHRG